jgi:DsbC/DsbD-like thiol-disulfide interchange protein
MKSLKIALALIFLLSLTLGVHAQRKADSEAADIKFSLQDEDQLTVGAKTKLVIEVTPKKNWHVYSALPSDDGAYQPTVVGYEITSRGFEASAKLDENGPMLSMFDEIMNGTVRYYKAPVVFSQELKLTETEVVLAGYFDYMACNEEKCIPLTAEFNFDAKAKE